ncbi:Protein of unknown function (DUF3405) [Geosmithia morbida]|uniref:Major facilitator superfamily transporter n=1 Tax=Geosmithia morbida TaxID=1094350 RepID=A0A9P5D6C9_9HYPO|nr:Protein of unknown function (DUF3405) [Geosmithia morbida]KAF4123379.1 Protein of unknown function (DUF3405) [Geosmithia morbida]
MSLFRGREQRLPIYERTGSPVKERSSNDDDDYSVSDVDGEPFTNRSGNTSRSVSGSLASAAPMLNTDRPRNLKRVAGVYPYRLPTKVTRHLCLGVAFILLLLIASLIRASQVDNWKVANGKSDSRPGPAHIWERFPFLERYYGGIYTLVPLKESNPEYPSPTEGTRKDSPLRRVGEEDTDEQDEGKEPLETRSAEPPTSHPWADYAGRAREGSEIKECFLDAKGKVRVPSVRYHEGRPYGFPRNVVGSYEIFDFPEDICFDRFGRYGPYGFGYSLSRGGLGTGENGENAGSAAVWEDVPRVDFRGIDWADLQRRCYRANADRFDSPPAKKAQHGFFIHDSESSSIKRAVDETGKHPTISDDDRTEIKTTAEDETETSTTKDDGRTGDKPATEDNVETPVPNKSKGASVSDSAGASPAEVEKTPRTAIVIRAWDEFHFQPDDVASLRAMITELSLASGGRYDIHLLVQVKNDAAFPIWAEDEAYERRINETIPEEFRGLVTLWTETQMLALYQGIYDLFARGPSLPVHGVYRGLTMAMQHFAYMHPEYDYFWQWEMDVRYTGHYHDLFTKLESWAKAQPRKGLWERNGRFYFPEVHGTWEDFSQMARIQNEMGTINADNVWDSAPGIKPDPNSVGKKRKSIWGPVRPADTDDWFEPGNDPIPPRGGPEKDKSEWGVGEEADYISLNPMFDPEGTTWGLRDDITGYNKTNGGPPRRANIITTSRMSRRLLMTMHRMTAYKKQFAFPEMWPATVALQHGYKAVFAPHPLYVDRKWPVDFMSQTFNGGRDGSVGGARTSVFGDREHNLLGLSWFYNAGFGPNLYRRWLGLRVNNDGGEEFEKIPDKTKLGGSPSDMAGGEGRMCLPPMLLHPVKEVELPVEEPDPENDEQEGGKKKKKPEFDAAS